ncbi:hypothetical protein ACFCV8_26030 [Streptomyces sp. NPDC056347]|uniref:hypothetical protein n=1 Tax=Streptomyces sp. NPDC056347 TaxID=3345790 RepID=UPI0035DB9C59
MALMNTTDPDFRVCRIGFDVLLDIQRDAEHRSWGTRWTSVDALRSQVKEESVVLRPLMREERAGALRAYRCLVLFAATDGGGAGGVATIDLDPARYLSLDRLDRDPDVREVLVRMFALAADGISMVPKK